MPRHNHNDGNYNVILKIDGNWTGGDMDYTPGEPNLVTTGRLQDSGGNQPHNIMQPFMAINYIMKI